jgi:hypothetical protein
MLTTPKLGLAGHKEDPRGRTLKIKDFIKPDLAYPAACDLTFGLIPDVDALGNDAVGCCAIAGPAHFARWEDQLCKRQTNVFTANVIDEYQNFGYVPGDETTDNGCYALDVFKRWRNVGLFGRKIEAFAQVDFFNPDEIAAATFLLGGVFFCFNLPNKVKDGSIFEAQTWDVATDGGGVAGGHLIWDRISWGERKYPTQPFIARYCFDAFAVVSAESIKPDGRAFSGLDLGGLQEALEAVTA